MCGIFSVFHNEKTFNRDVAKLIANLTWVDAIRGHHSTGFIYEAEGQPDYYKKAISGYDFLQLNFVQKIIDNYHKTPYLIGHNRAATRGEVNHSNAHPFQSDHLVGVHNGTLTNHHSLSPIGFNHPVDSAHLYAALAKDGTKDTLPRVNGSFNLLWHDNSDNTIHMVKNANRPYTFAKIKGKDILVGASEKDMLKWLIKREHLAIEYCWTPKNNHEYVFLVDDNSNILLEPVEVIEHEAYVPPKVVKSPHQQQNVNKNNKVVNITAGPAKKPVDSPDSGIVEFTLNRAEPQDYKDPSTGEKYVIYTGHTTKGSVPVMVYNAIRSDGFVLGRKYTGDGYVSRVGDTFKYTIDAYTVKNAVEIEDHVTKDEGLAKCVQCGQKKPVKDTITLAGDVVCLDCCEQHNVMPHEVDADTRHRMFNYAH